MRRTTAFCSVASILIASAATANTLFEQFKKSPSPQAALALAKLAQRDPAWVRRGLLLPEQQARLMAWALYHYPHPAVREELEYMLESPDQVAGYWAARAGAHWRRREHRRAGRTAPETGQRLLGDQPRRA